MGVRGLVGLNGFWVDDAMIFITLNTCEGVPADSRDWNGIGIGEDGVVDTAFHRFLWVSDIQGLRSPDGVCDMGHGVCVCEWDCQ